MVGRIAAAFWFHALPAPSSLRADDGEISKKARDRGECDRTIDIYTKAAEIFHEQGFDATSMSSIAAAVDLTKAGLYYYIESKRICSLPS